MSATPEWPSAYNWERMSRPERVRMARELLHDALHREAVGDTFSDRVSRALRMATVHIDDPIVTEETEDAGPSA